MKQFSVLLIATSIAAGTAMAGQIQINGVNGLTSTSVTAGTFSEKGYDPKLFDGSTLIGGVSPTPYAGYQVYNAAPGSLQDPSSGVVFNMINDGCFGPCNMPANDAGFSNNTWVALSAGTITIPIGINDPLAVWTMLNNIWGTPGANDTNITFDFSANGVALTPLVLNLINANNDGTTGGQIESSLDCTTVGNLCSTYAGSNNSSTAPSSVVNGITVKTGTLYTVAYANDPTYPGSAGTLSLNDQGFIFAGTQYASDFLVDIKVTELNGKNVLQSGTPSETSLAAITVVTPEPSPVFLIVAGIGAIGISRFRRRTV